MTLTSTSYLDIVDLIIYLIIFPLTLFLAYRHGKPGILGYFYLIAACAVRVVADIVSLLPANVNATHPTTATVVLSSIGLSPLLLALSGFLHEIHVRLVTVTQNVGQVKKTKRWLWFIQFQIHATAILGVLLAVIAGVSLVTAETSSGPTDIHTIDKVQSAGAVILCILWAILIQYGLYLIYLAREVRMVFSGSIDVLSAIIWILFAVSSTGLRCASFLLYAFDRGDTAFNPITGALWVKIIFVFLGTLGAVIGMCISGWVSRNLSERLAPRKQSGSYDVSYESLRNSKA